MQQARYTPTQIADAMRRAGFPESQIPTGIAVATAESSLRPLARNRNVPVEDSVGVWQINLLAHPNINLGCASDLTCSTRAAFQISGGGTDWSPWGAFTNGSYLNYINRTTSSLPSQPSAVPPTPGTAGAGDPVDQGAQRVAAGLGAGGIAPTAAPSTIASQLAGSSFLSTPIVGGLLQVGVKAVITVGLIALIFVGAVKLVGGSPSKVAKEAKG